MKNFKGTPAPWGIEKQSEEGEIKIVTNEREVAAVWRYDVNEDDPVAGVKDTEVEHNAKLIAAAPELLKAVQLWNEFFEKMPKGQFGKIVCDIGIMNEAFIATNTSLRKALE